MTDTPAKKREAQYLLTESPMIIYPSLALRLGVNKAVIFQQLHFLLNGVKSSKSQYNRVADEWWVYNSYQEWRDEHFIWLSAAAIKNLFLSLEELGLVRSMQSVRNKSDRRKWYTIDYDAWETYCTTIGQKVSDEPWDKKYPMVGYKVSDGYTDTTTDSSTEKDGDVAKAPRAPRKTKKERASENAYISQFVDAFPEGYKPPVTTRMLDTANALKEAGYSPEQLAELIRSKLTGPTPRYDYKMHWALEDIAGFLLQRRPVQTSPATAEIMRQRADLRERQAVQRRIDLGLDVPDVAH